MTNFEVDEVLIMENVQWAKETSLLLNVSQLGWDAFIPGLVISHLISNCLLDFTSQYAMTKTLILYEEIAKSLSENEIGSLLPRS